MAVAFQLGGDPAAPVLSTFRTALERDPVSPTVLSGVLLEILTRLRFDEAAVVLYRAETANAFPPEILALFKARLEDWQGNDAKALAMAEGDKDGALDALEFVEDFMFEELHGDPRYEALHARVKAHLAAEREAAEEAGLLPIPAELLARLETD